MGNVESLLRMSCILLVCSVMNILSNIGKLLFDNLMRSACFGNVYVMKLLNCFGRSIFVPVEL